MVKFDPKIEKYTKIFFVGVLIFHILHYWLGSMIFYPMLDGYLIETGDFAVFMKGIQFHFFNPDRPFGYNIYEGSLLPAYNLKNLPTVGFYYMIFYFLPSENNFNAIIFSFYNLGWNLGVCYMIYKITKTRKYRKICSNNIFKYPYLMMSAYLLVLLHIIEYSVGQTNAIACFFILTGIYFLLEEKEPLGILFFAISLNFKMISFLIPAIFIFQKPFKQFIKYVAIFVIALSPNIIFFLLLPNNIMGFIKTNLTYANEWSFIIIPTSISLFFCYIFSIEQVLVPSLIFMVIVIPVNFILLTKYHQNLNVIDRIFIAMLTIMAVIPGITFIHSIMYLGTFLLWLSTKNDMFNSKIKLLPAIYLFSVTAWIYLIIIPIINFLVLIYVDFKIITSNEEKQLHQLKRKTVEENIQNPVVENPK